jgi:hypothetical protein
MEIQIPTVLLILGSTNAELMRIHAHYPLLAFLLSIANTNKRPDRAQPTPIHTTPASSVGIWTIHVLAAIGAGVVIWQTIEIGRNGVVSWACPTDWYPVLWIGMAVVHHAVSVVLMRWSLSVTAVPAPALPSSASARKPSRPATASAFTCWDLTQPGIRVEVHGKRFAKWSKATADLVNNYNFLFGTAIFASLTLVSGVVALKKLATFGGVAIAARVAADYVLEGIEERK